MTQCSGYPIPETSKGWISGMGMEMESGDGDGVGDGGGRWSRDVLMVIGG